MADLWFADKGSGSPLLLLHPGGTDARSLQPLIGALGDGHRLITPEHRGHGRTPDVDGGWHFADMAADTSALLDHLHLSNVDVFGWSDGAIIGLYLAIDRPDLVRSLVFGGAPFDVNGWHEGVLSAEPPAFMAESYAELSPDGIGHWPVVVAKSAALHAHEPAVTLEQLRTLGTPILVLVADDDEVRLSHAIEMYDALPEAELAVVPRSTHGLIIEKPDLVARLITEFRSPGKSNGIAPLRRAAV